MVAFLELLHIGNFFWLAKLLIQLC